MKITLKTPDVPLAWRDPSGWRPTELQLSVPPETRGLRYGKWIRLQPVCTQAALDLWITAHLPPPLSGASRTAKK